MSRRPTLIVLGLALAGVGALAAMGGGALLATVGTNGSSTSHPATVSTDTPALVSQLRELRDRDGFHSALDGGTLTLSTSGDEVFLGVGPADEVDRFLAGTAFDELTEVDFDPFTYRAVRHPGEARSARPDSQGFWVAQAEGDDPELTWDIEDERYRLVVMHPDGTAGISVRAQAGVTVPVLGELGVGLLAGGLAGVAAGSVLLVAGARSRPDTGPAARPSERSEPELVGGRWLDPR